MALQSPTHLAPSAPRPYDEQPVPAVEVEGLIRGVRWRSAIGEFPYVPDLSSVQADATGTITSLNAPEFPVVRGAVELTGWIEVPVDGEYRFTMRCQTHAFLRLHEASLIDCDHGYEQGEPRSATIRLAKGLHRVCLTCLAYDQPPEIELAWELPGSSESVPTPSYVWFCQ